MRFVFFGAPIYSFRRSGDPKVTILHSTKIKVSLLPSDLDYDSCTTIFSPEGRLYQVEYVMEAIGNAGAAMGILAQDGVILVGEKKVTSKLFLTSHSTEKMYKIDDHLACVVAGIMSDANILINTAGVQAQRYTFGYQERMPVEQLVQSLCDTKQGYTQFGGLRPFGASPSSLKAAQSMLKQDYKDEIMPEEAVQLALKVLSKPEGAACPVEIQVGAQPHPTQIGYSWFKLSLCLPLSVRHVEQGSSPRKRTDVVGDKPLPPFFLLKPPPPTQSLFLQMPLLLPSSLFPAGLKPYVLAKSLPRGRPWRSLLRLPPWSLATAPSPAVAVSDDVDAFTKYSGYLFEGGASSEAEFLRFYDFPSIAAIYRRRPFLVLRRFIQITVAFGRWFAERYIDSVSDRSDEMFEDVIPPAYLDELSLLQDRIASFSTEIAFSMIEEELGQPIEMLFSEISPEPIAAASLGQVYQARLHSSRKLVAVKVQRPGVQAAIALDIFILRYIAGVVRRAAKLNTDLQAVLDEWASSLFREMDYRAEAMNGLKFRKLFGGLRDVVVPEMYLEQTSRRVLVMEWVEGRKLSDIKDLYLVEVGVYCSLSQLLEHGFYHADPHPGNLLRTSDGKLAYLDFGMMGEFKQELQDGFIQACLHLVNRDFDALSNDFVILGLLPPTAQKDEVAKALTGVFQNAVNKGVRNISFGDLSGNLGQTMYKFKFQIPSYFSLVIRSLAVLEGIAISFDPNYKVLSSSYPWIARKVLTDSSPQLQSTLQTLLYKEGIFRIDRLESLLTELSFNDLPASHQDDDDLFAVSYPVKYLLQSLRAKTEESLVRKEPEGNGSRRVISQVLSFTLTEKGAFLREILIQEFAKKRQFLIFNPVKRAYHDKQVLVQGLDALGVATLDSVSSAAFARLPLSVPYSSSLMADEDIANLRTLSRLLLLLSRLQKNENPNSEVKYANREENKNADLEEVSLVLYQMTSVQDILPLLSVIPELPEESQQQLVRLPSDLAGRLLSRVVARSIRRIFS
ncbi:hypothetical protein ZIOFF_043195 [Zingiber officinale]|uniref:Protein kinase domain-containing protein n=1 Tax=Zingiber officinale TaxID=94328 RepID=A0A8J5GAA0_ZINOF|nr:hypothetical protein ZIOFF_043195 [Zingiber officinale]